MRAHGINVRGEDVRLDLVSCDLLWGSTMVNGIDQSEKLPSPVVFTQEGEGHDRPRGGMSVLSAILPHPRRVTFDIARVELRLIERRIKELNEIGIAADKALADSFHGLPAALRITSAADHRPALWQRIDLALWIGPGAKWLAVVEVGAAIPVSVPGVLCNVVSQLPGVGKATSGKSAIVALACQLRKLR